MTLTERLAKASDLILRDALGTDPTGYSPDSPDWICIRVADLTRIVERHLRADDAAWRSAGRE